jgi:hypothetical protein
MKPGEGTPSCEQIAVKNTTWLVVNVWEVRLRSWLQEMIAWGLDFSDRERDLRGGGVGVIKISEA